LWSNGATTEDISGLSAGTYTCTITRDGFFTCTIDYEVTIANDVTFDIAGVATDEYCGNANGAIDQTIITGSGLTYVWSHGPTTEDVTGLTAGAYTCVVTDPLAACTDTLDYVIVGTSNGTVINSVIADEVCGQSNGSIDLALTGGSGMFTFAWDNAAATEDVSGLASNTYEVTVTDQGDGCIITESFVVGSTSTLFDGSGVVTDENCGQMDGAIDVTLSGATTYTYSWDNGATTEDLTGVGAGTYVLTATSAEGCDTTMTFVVTGLGTVFNVTGVVTNATCATCADGFIDVTGWAGFTYSWNTGATTQDITLLNPGQYTLTVTATSGCDTTLVFDVLNTASLEEMAALSINVDVHPNPATDQFVVNYEMPTGQDGEIVITDALGKIIDRINVTGTDALPVDARNYATGMYFITLQSRKITKVKRVVVNRY
jgi:hypothetical protein